MKVTVPEGTTMWLGHNSRVLFASAAVLFIAQDAAGTAAPSWVNWTSNAVSAVVLYSLYAEFSVHNRQLCERCIAASPLDPQAAVRRWKAALRAAHARALQWGIVAGWTVKIVLGFALGHDTWLFAADAVLCAACAVTALSYWLHRRLYPWCPFCRWDEGGGHEVSPDVPAPAVTR